MQKSLQPHQLSAVNRCFTQPPCSVVAPQPGGNRHKGLPVPPPRPPLGPTCQRRSRRRRRRQHRTAPAYSGPAAPDVSRTPAPRAEPAPRPRRVGATSGTLPEGRLRNSPPCGASVQKGKEKRRGHEEKGERKKKGGWGRKINVKKKTRGKKKKR